MSNEEQMSNEMQMEKYLRLMCFGDDVTKESIEREIRKQLAKEEDVKGIQLIVIAPGLSEERQKEIETLKEIFPCAIYWGVRVENEKKTADKLVTE